MRSFVGRRWSCEAAPGLGCASCPVGLDIGGRWRSAWTTSRLEGSGSPTGRLDRARRWCCCMEGWETAGSGGSSGGAGRRLHGDGLGRAGLRRVIGSRLVVMPGVGHQSGMEAPDRFNAEVRGFLRSVLMSRAGTPRRRENRGGLPADAGAFLVVEAVESVWRRGLDLDGSLTVLGARRSDFRLSD